MSNTAFVESCLENNFISAATARQMESAWNSALRRAIEIARQEKSLKVASRCHKLLSTSAKQKVKP